MIIEADKDHMVRSRVRLLVNRTVLSLFVKERAVTNPKARSRDNRPPSGLRNYKNAMIFADGHIEGTMHNDGLGGLMCRARKAEGTIVDPSPARVVAILINMAHSVCIPNTVRRQN